MKRLFVFFVLFLGWQGLHGQSLDDSLEVSVNLAEIEISSWKTNTVLKRAIRNLPKMNKGSLMVGEGQITQIIECNDNVVQLSREYGVFSTTGFNIKCDRERACIYDPWILSFISFYNARSLRYNANGKDTLSTAYLDIRSGSSHGLSSWKDDVISYDARRKYIFDIIRVIYLFGPIYSRSISDYSFNLIKTDDPIYCFSFESINYPDKNPLYAKGTVEINVDEMKLSSIRIDRMGMHYAGMYGRIRDDKKETKSDCVDCVFEMDERGEIKYALVHIPWNDSISQYYRPGCGNQSRSRSSAINCLVTECWKTENITDVNKIAGAEKKQKKALSLLLGRGNGGGNFSKYDEDIINKIKWALDVSEAERQLDSKMPIKEQYARQSKDYYSSLLDWAPEYKDNPSPIDSAQNIVFSHMRDNMYDGIMNKKNR